MSTVMASCRRFTVTEGVQQVAPGSGLRTAFTAFTENLQDQLTIGIKSFKAGDATITVWFEHGPCLRNVGIIKVQGGIFGKQVEPATFAFRNRNAPGANLYTTRTGHKQHQ